MRVIILAIISSISLHIAAQDYGYFGKKNTLSVNAILYNPMLYNLFNQDISYKKSGSGVTPGKSNLDYGYALAFSHYFSGSFGLGAEVGMVYGKISAPENYDFKTLSQSSNSFYDYSSGIIKTEQFKISTLTIMPKIEYTFSGEQLPIGINHQFGFGVSITKLIEDSYNYEVIQYYSDLNLPFNKSMLTPYDEVGKFYNLTAMYAFNVRTPITRSLMINYGLKYNINVALSTLKDEIFYSSDGNPNQTAETIKEEIRQKKSTSLLSFNIGLTFVF